MVLPARGFPSVGDGVAEGVWVALAVALALAGALLSDGLIEGSDGADEATETGTEHPVPSNSPTTPAARPRLPIEDMPPVNHSADHGRWAPTTRHGAPPSGNADSGVRVAG